VLTRGIFVFFAAALAVAAAPVPGTGEARLMRYPDISRNQVVFSYAADLWVAPRAGGEARRITAHPGDELFPHFSPEGGYIAFTGEYDGNLDVFVVPAAGGEPRRLTFHPGADTVLGWTPDGKNVLYRSTRTHPLDVAQLFLVSLDGGPSRRLPLARASMGSFSPDGKRIAFTPTSREMRHWKRYRGGWKTYIGIYDLTANTYQELPRADANNMFPMWHGDAIYFISDRDGVFNLYSYGLKNRRTAQLTRFTEFDVKWPSLGPGAVIFENGGQLFAYDLKKKKSRKIPISIETDAVAARAELKPVGGRIRQASLSPSGVRALLSARGEIFTLPVKHGSPRNLTRSPGVHELAPAWSPDGKWVAYLSDRSGEYEIWLRPQKGGAEQRVTTDGECYRYGLTWSPDSEKIFYWDKKLRLWYVDIGEKKPVLVDTLDYEPETESLMSWSPDSRWIAYSKPTSPTNQFIALYSLETKAITPVTDGFYADDMPRFDSEGKCLYFRSPRYYYPSWNQLDSRYAYQYMDGLFAVTLQADEKSPFAPRNDEEGEEAKEPEKKSAGPAGKTEEAGGASGNEDKQPGKPVKIDLDGIGRRVVKVPVPPGNYRDFEVRKGKLFYLTTPFEATQAGRPGPRKPAGSLSVYDIGKREAKPLLQGINSFALDLKGNKLLYRAGKVFGVVDAQPGKAKVGEGKLALDGLEALVDPRREWKQMLHEAWRIERDFYWEPGMGGLDWAAIGARYKALLPWVVHRSDLNYLIGDMIAELSTSHTYVGGGEMPARRHINVGLLGVDFSPGAGYYRLAKIYRVPDWNSNQFPPLAGPGLKVKEGDYLIAVNGVPAPVANDPYSYFQGLGGKLVWLTINDRPSPEGAWKIQVKTVTSERRLRYLDWVEATRRKVSEATHGRVGYMHVPDTSTGGIIMFERYLAAQTGKEALIVDERNNGGGRIPDFFTEKLARRRLNFISPREGKDQSWPPLAVAGPKVMIVNELAGSGGDAFPWYFKKLKIGPIVGTRTWGGLVGISRNIPMMDGGVVTAPEFAFWSAEDGGKWVVENHGVDPDYVVEQRPDLEAQGRDPQLEKAIALALELLKKRNPPPPRPPYPRKR